MSGPSRVPFDKINEYRTKLMACVIELEETMALVKKFATQASEGGLIGKAGTQLLAALTEQLNPAIGRLREATLEEIKDLELVSVSTDADENALAQMISNRA